MGALCSWPLEHQVLYPIFHELDIRIAIIDMNLGLFRDTGRRYYARVGATHLEQEHICHDLQENANP